MKALIWTIITGVIALEIYLLWNYPVTTIGIVTCLIILYLTAFEHPIPKKKRI